MFDNSLVDEHTQFQRIHDGEEGYFSFAGFRALQHLKSTSRALFVSHCGEEACVAGHYYDEIRIEYHMHFILNGRGVFNVDGITHNLQKGDIFLVPKGKKNYYKADEKDPWHYAWVALSGSNAWQCLEQAGFSKQKLTRKAFAPPEEYYALIMNMLEARILTHANEMRRMSELYAILSLLVRSRMVAEMESDKQLSYKNNKHVNHAVQYMQSNYSTASVAQVADYVGLNRSYLTTLFKQVLALSPQEYLTRIKMGKAASLLETTERRINEIGISVGYEDPLSFTKAFHKYCGVSPRQYRKEKLCNAKEPEIIGVQG